MHAFPSRPRATRRRALAAALLALPVAALAAGCVDRTVAPRAANPIRLAITVGTAAIPNGSLDVAVFYRQDNATTGAQVSLFSQRLRSDDLAGSLPASFDSRCAGAQTGTLQNCTVQMPIELDLARCLADNRRRPEGGGCPVVVTLVLRDANGRQLGTATAGPIQVFPGQAVVFPEMTLPLRG